MRLAMLSMLMMVSCGAVSAHAQRLEVDQAEVLRHGDMVQHIDGLQAGGADDEVLGPPESDADQWFISVVSTKGCAGCERLKQAWRSDPNLLALANPDNPKTSWAHYNEYLYEDQSQAFRWQDIRITAFPTVIVQPARSGKYGDPRTVVFQDVYRGDPKQLAGAISNAIRRYVATLDTAPTHPGPRAADNASVAPPWSPAPKVEPQRLPDIVPIKIPPESRSEPFSWQQLLWQVIAAVVTAVLGYFAGRRTLGSSDAAPSVRAQRSRKFVRSR